MDNDDRKTVTCQVKNLVDIVTSPRKQKDGTHVKWFQFAAVNEDGTKRGTITLPSITKGTYGDK